MTFLGNRSRRPGLGAGRWKWTGAAPVALFRGAAQSTSRQQRAVIRCGSNQGCSGFLYVPLIIRPLVIDAERGYAEESPACFLGELSKLSPGGFRAGTIGTSTQLGRFMLYDRTENSNAF
jgi:hypothetical protein